MIRDTAKDAELRRALVSPARFTREVLRRAILMLPLIADVDDRDDCAREIAVAACAAGFARMSAILVTRISAPFQRCWALVAVAYVHAILRRMRHARLAIRIAQRAVDEMPGDHPVRCEIGSLLALACALNADADGFEEAAGRVPEAIAATDDEADQVEALTDLAVGSLALGDSARGAAWLADAEAIVQAASIGSKEHALEHLAIAYATIGDDTAAIIAAESVIRSPPFQANLFGRLSLAAATRQVAASGYVRRALIICRSADWNMNPRCYDAGADVATA